ncbi:MAG: pyruvate, phosphate dikinase [Myxococcota bacterium]
MEHKRINVFGLGTTNADVPSSALLGNKGANLAEMARQGLPVPPGFTLPTEVCRRVLAEGALPADVRDDVQQAVRELEAATGKRLGDPERPLLLAVRSGSRVSMPGILDTVLGVGMTDDVAAALAKASGNARFARDVHRRFLARYATVVMGIRTRIPGDQDPFHVQLDRFRTQRGLDDDEELSEADAAEVVNRFRTLIRGTLGADVPQDPHHQLTDAITAVFLGWRGPRATAFRRANHISDEEGTACTVQAMVFGTLPPGCSGVAITRHPNTGVRVLYGEYLPDAHGEDIVGGARTPCPLSESRGGRKPLKEAMPAVYEQLHAMCTRLEAHFKDVQEVEFTVQEGKLWLLQTRSSSRTARAAVKSAVDMAGEGLITQREALLRVDASRLDTLLVPQLSSTARKEVLAQGLPASPGVACGKVVFHAEEAEALKAKGLDVILVRTETSSDDVGGMRAASGILTARGGTTSHAAVVARAMGKCCVVGCSGIRVDYVKAEFVTTGGVHVRQGDVITLDGNTGDVLVGPVQTEVSSAVPELDTLLSWADQVRRLKVRSNSDTPQDAELARKLGAEGVGLCRTEHMFFEAARLRCMQELSLSTSSEGRRAAMARLLPMQRDDFLALFRTMAGAPITIRLLDLPLESFLPDSDRQRSELSAVTGLSLDEIRVRSDALRHSNPLLGHRGCRLAVTYPEIYEMQVRALLEAACQVHAEGISARPEIMLPMVVNGAEYASLRALVVRTAEKVFGEKGVKVPFLVGPLIELPRAALAADELAVQSDFFSLGTDDMTRMALGLSRDDMDSFLQAYLDQGLLRHDPFVVLDERGVGGLVRTAVDLGRGARAGLLVGICGEHGGEPESVAFFHRAGLDYVSCTALRVPVARLAAAQAAINAG